MKHTGRAAMALLLLVSGYVAAIVLALFLIVELFHLVGSGLSIGSVAGVVVPVLGLSVLGVLGRRVADARAAETPEGIALAQTAQPRLWVEVQSTADRVSSRAPDEIWVVDRVGVELVEDSSLLGLRPGRRRLVVGVPLMLGLSAEQLRFVIAHELAHDSSRQPAVGTVLHRAVDAIRRLRPTLGDSLLERLLLVAGKGIEEIALPALHAQELNADRIAAELVGSRTAIAALKELGPLEEAWQEFAEHYVLPGVLVGQRPTDLFGGFVDFLDDDTRQEWMAQYDTRHPAGTTPIPGHPQLSQRFLGLRELSTTRQLDFSGPAEDVLDRREVVFEALEGAVTADSTLQPSVFSRVVPRGTAARIAQQVTSLGNVARQLDLWPLEESLLLQVVRAGREAPLMRALAPDADGDELDRLAGQVVADLAAHRLVEAGRASFTLSWSAAPALLDRHGATLDPWSVAARATQSAQGVEELREWLAEHQVRLVRPAPPSAPSTPSTPSPTPAPPAPATAKPLVATVGAAATVVAAATAPEGTTGTPAPARQTTEAPAKPAARSTRPPKPARPDTPPPAPVAAPAPAAVAVAPAAPPVEQRARKSSSRDLMAHLLRRVSGQDEHEEGLAAPQHDTSSVAAVEAIVRDRWDDTPESSRLDLPAVQRPQPPSDADDVDGASERAAEADDEGPEPTTDASPAPTQREALKAALKELDRLRRAQEAAEKEAAAPEAEAPEAEAEGHDDGPGPDAQDAGDADEASRDDHEGRHDDEPPTGPPVLNPDLAAAIAALGGMPSTAESEPQEPEDAAGAGWDSWPPVTEPDAAADTPQTPEEAPVPAAAFAAAPAAQELTGVLAAAAPIAGSARGTLVVSPIGISLRRPSLAEMARLAQQRAARGAALLSRAVGLSVNDLTSNRRTETLSWSDISHAEFSGLSEDKGVLTLYVGMQPAQRVEFLSTTEIHGDLLGVLESLLGPRLRVS